MGIKKLAKSGMFGLAGLAATNPDITNKIARSGGFGVLGMMAAKKKKAAQMGGAPMMDSRPAVGGPGDVDAMMGRSAQNDMSGMKKGGKVKKKPMVAKKMASGGSASRRGDGIARKGKTKGKFV
jgi:hypothetical protein